MPVLGTIEADLKAAMKASESLRVSTLRLVKAALKNKEIDKKAPLSDDEALSVLSTLAKQRRESIEQFTKAGRPDLADKEQKELEILQAYMPKQLSTAELDAAIAEAIRESGAQGPSDMGKAMKAVMAKVKGQADGKAVGERVKELLSGAK